MKKRNRTAFINILSALLLKGIAIFTSPVFSRLLGTGGYGVVQNFTVWSGVMAIAGTMNTHASIVNARVEYPEEEQKRYQSSIMALSMLLFLSITLVVLIFLGPLSSLLQMQKLIILLVLFQAFGSFCVNFMNSKFTYELKAGRNMVMSVAVTLSTFAISVVCILLLPKQINYYGRMLGNALVYGGLGIVICAYVLLSGKTLYNRAYWRFAVTLSLPLAFQAISDMILGHSDLVMLKQMCGDSASGIYGLSYNFSGVMFAIFGALNNTWVPFFFENMRKQEFGEAKKHGVYFMELYTVLSAGFVLLGTEVYHVFARSDFWGGTGLIPVFVGSYYLNFLCTFPVNFEYFHKRTKMVAGATILSSVINIGLNYLFILRFGMFGAAIATAISHGIQYAAHYGYTKLFLREQTYPFGVDTWGKYTLLFLAACAMMYLLPNGWYIRWALGAALGIWELLRIYRRKVLL